MDGTTIAKLVTLLVLIAAFVGAVLIIINYGDAIVRGDLDAVQLFRIGLTVFVPYCVSTASSVEAMRSLGRQAQSTADEPAG